jgi:hypothetical protein
MNAGIASTTPTISKSNSPPEQSYSAVTHPDEKHAQYWRSHILPICGIVFDPESETARWVDLTAFLKSAAGEPAPYKVNLSPNKLLDREHFREFREHFLAYRTELSQHAHFGQALADFAHMDDIPRCRDAIRALFSFHRNRLETWYYLAAGINNFRNHPLLPLLVTRLTHVPGHMDIFWTSQNAISEPVREKAEELFRRVLTRDMVLTLVGAIGEEGGIVRGSLGQSIHAIVSLADQRRTLYRSIILDRTVPEVQRYWVVLMLLADEQHRQSDDCYSILSEALPGFSEEMQDSLRECLPKLKAHEYIDVT